MEIPNRSRIGRVNIFFKTRADWRPDNVHKDYQRHTDNEGLRTTISEPFEIMSDIECSLADQKDDLENAFDEFDFAQVEELSDQLRSIQRVLY